jgi:threonine dehydratase
VPDHLSPTPEQIRATLATLGSQIVRTPVAHWRGPEIEAAAGAQTDIFLKLELLQVTGTFKPRGAVSVISSFDADTRARGVTAVSAGNHAIAVAYAAKHAKTDAKVVMPKNANAARVARCKAYGAQVVLADSIAHAFELVQQFRDEEGRGFIHPFEGPLTTLGTATLGLELCEQVASLDAVIVPIGGGGLCAGVAAAVKQLQPQCAVYGVEPKGAQSMTLSFKAGEPRAIDAVTTIADSLGAPYALEGTYTLCKRHVDEIVLVSDDELRASMAFLFHNAKLAVEPAGAAATAALLGPLASRLRGKRVALVVCGSNIDLSSFAENVQRGGQVSLSTPFNARLS